MILKSNINSFQKIEKAFLLSLCPSRLDFLDSRWPVKNCPGSFILLNCLFEGVIRGLNCCPSVLPSSLSPSLPLFLRICNQWLIGSLVLWVASCGQVNLVNIAHNLLFLEIKLIIVILIMCLPTFSKLSDPKTCLPLYFGWNLCNPRDTLWEMLYFMIFAHFISVSFVCQESFCHLTNSRREGTIIC